MPDYTLTLTITELGYLRRAVERDLENLFEVPWKEEYEEYQMREEKVATRVFRRLRRVEQEQVHTH